MHTAPHRPDNEAIADQLEEASELLYAHGADPYRVRAFRDAARTLRTLDESVVDVLDREDAAGLIRIPTVGRSIASAIEEMAWRGRWPFLDRLRGEVTPEELFMTLPGVGEELAARIHHELEIDTLEELELAAHEGRLEKVRGIGPRRAHAIRDLLATQLRRSTRRRARRIREESRPASAPPHEAPTVERLLEVDAAYRSQAEAGELHLIAPRRFNAGAKRWLPIWHTEGDGFEFTALYSNSAMAHRLGKTQDWVVIYWERDGHEDQATVVTEYRGPLNGRRVVRGRERECLAYWAQQTARK